jgi:hypothetical protein
VKFIILVRSLLCLLALCPAGSAQSASVAGDIRGTITDPSGAVLPRATVKAMDPQVGLQRTAVARYCCQTQHQEQASLLEKAKSTR